jgi:hypothetical protein
MRVMVMGLESLIRPRAPPTTHRRAKLDPTPLWSASPAMFTVQAFRHTQRAPMHHLVGHDPAISADGATRRLHCSESVSMNMTKLNRIWHVFENPRLATIRASFDRDLHTRDHSLDTLPLCLVSFAQPLAIPRAGQTFTPPTSRTISARLCRASQARPCPILRSFLADLGRRFDSSHFISLQATRLIRP